ncbi:MAG: hypothetical protein JWM10_767 [Myxococcaceae bacterium]|nr:hypothetical protein [Myxococcaceae bacterium]
MEPRETETRGLQVLADALRDYHCARIRARVVVDLLCDRGVPVEEEVRRRILACEDLAVLRAWTLHATTAVSAEQFGATVPGPRVDLYEDTPNAALRAMGDEFEARFGARLRAQALLDLLEDLAVRVEPAVGVRICAGDAPVLRRWTLRVAAVRRPSELFDDAPDPLDAIERMAADPAHRDNPLVASFARAKARGQVKVLLRVLAARGVEVDESTRQRALSCADPETIDRWLCRAATADSAAAVFAVP